MKSDVEQVIRDLESRIVAGHQGKGQSEWEREELETAKEHAILAAGFPARALGLVRAGNLIETPALRAVRENQAATLVLAGDTGVGKTAAAVFRELTAAKDDQSWKIRRPRLKDGPILFLTAAQVVRWPRFDSDEMSRLLSTGGLVLDDMGSEALDEGGWALSMFDEIVDKKYSSGTRLTITTNMTPKNFAVRYGARIVDRLKEAGRWVSCGSVSLRGAPASGGKP